MKKILIIRLSSVGDVVMALPTAAQLKNKYGDSIEISWVIKSSYAGLLENNKFIDKIIYYEEFLGKYFRIIKEILRILNKKFDKEKYKKIPIIEKILKKFPVSKKIKSEKYDVVIDLQGSVESSLIALSAQAQVNLTPNFVNNGIERFYKRMETNNICEHRIEEYLETLKYLNVKKESKYCYGWNFDDNDNLSIQKLYQSINIDYDVQYIILALTTQWQSKNYPLEHWAKIIDFLNKKNKSVIIVGTNSDKNHIEKLKAIVSENSFIDLCGKTNIRELVLLIKNAALVIAGDSGPMHIASSLNIPVISIFGPTNPQKWGPVGKNSIVLTIKENCKFCYRTKCPKNKDCLKSIKPELVICEIEKLLK